jgi:putative addiction module component (TIGR02574 family)
MSNRLTKILTEVLCLPLGERADLAEKLLTSIDTRERQRFDASWALEAEERLDAYEQGKLKTVPVDQV